MTATSRAVLVLGLVLGAINVVLVNWSQPLFGGWWQYVMWEGGLLEDFTALQFIAGGVVFALCALRRGRPVAERRWLALYALAEFLLAGEETNYGRGTLFLDLTDPDFAKHYNPQAQNIHNVIFPDAMVPIAGFVVICLVLRLYYRPICTRLRLPMSMDFLDAVLVSAAFAAFMVFSFRDDRFLSVDEVYEWSSSVLLLCLALYYRFGWVFRPRAGEVGCAPAPR